jgi:hypothetical protein
MKISKMPLEHVRNEAHYQFLLIVKKLFETYTAVAAIVAPQLEKLYALIVIEGQLVDAVRASGYTAKIAGADHRRDRAVSGINTIVKSYLHYFDPLVVEAAQSLEIRLKSFRGEIEKKSYEEESAAVKILIADLQSTYLPAVEKLNLTAWVSELAAAQVEFDSLFALRNTEQAAMPQERLRSLRKQEDIIYRDIVDRIYAYTLMNGDQTCAGFINELNREIAYFIEHNHHHAKKDMDKAVVENIPTQIYGGEPVTVMPDVFYEGKKLVFTVDYELSYHDNNGPGTASVILHGKGAWKGKKTISFNIIRE